MSDNLTCIYYIFWNFSTNKKKSGMALDFQKFSFDEDPEILMQPNHFYTKVNVDFIIETQGCFKSKHTTFLSL